MDPLTLAKSILSAAGSLLGLMGKIKDAQQDQRDRISDLFLQISDCLGAVSSEVRLGNTPHGKCGELITYSEQLPALIEEQVGKEEAERIGDTLRSAYNVEEMAMEIENAQNRDEVLNHIDQASGRFRALANMMKV